MIVTIGTNDTLASPGAQLGYFQSVIERMGREKVFGTRVRSRKVTHQATELRVDEARSHIGPQRLLPVGKSWAGRAS